MLLAKKPPIEKSIGGFLLGETIGTSPCFFLNMGCITKNNQKSKFFTLK